MSTQEEEPLWFAGLDWASQSHRVSLTDASGKPGHRRDVSHDAAGYAALCSWLENTTQASPARIAIAIETTHGPAVDALLDRGLQVYAINPKQLDRFRDRFTVAGAKDDTRDADVLASSLRTDRNAFRRLGAEDPLIVQLREATRRHHTLVTDRMRLTSRMRDQLWRYYPQMLKLFDDLCDSWVLELWRLAPTPARGARLHKATIERVLKTHRIRRLSADQVRAILREPALVVAPGVTQATSNHIRDLLPHIRLLNSQIKHLGREVDRLTAALAGPPIIEPGESVPGQRSEQRDVTILLSVPGIGRIGGATLLAEAHDAVRTRDYQILRLVGGVAPVTRRSGKSCTVLRRVACNKRLADTLYHMARVAIGVDPQSRARYDALRERGHRHARALRSVADRLLFVLCTLLKRQVLFDPDYRASPANA
jgi:transposase